MLFLRLLSYLPLPIHYLIADFLFFVAYYLVRYRRRTVWKNLINSFPDKKESELRDIERKFYKNLADTSVETLKLLTISEKDLVDRVKIDSSIPMKYFKLGYPTFVMTSHFCNWEWLLVACTNQVGFKLHAGYKRLRNPFFNKLMKKIRGRFGVVMHERDDIIRDLVKMKDEPFLMAMVADQRPFTGENKYWSKFLNQEAAFYSGTELLARRMDIKVIYVSMQRVRRGHYDVKFEEIEEFPKASAPDEITEKFVRLAENDIFLDPSSYLWSHDRWKHLKPTQ